MGGHFLTETAALTNNKLREFLIGCKYTVKEATTTSQFCKISLPNLQKELSNTF